jgi:hypothetical protein
MGTPSRTPLILRRGLGQGRLQFLACVAQPALDRFAFDAGNSCYRVYAQPGLFVQQECVTLFVR